MAGVSPVGTFGLTTWTVSTSTAAAQAYMGQIDQNLIVSQRFGDSFAVHEQTTGDMTVRVDPGWIFSGTNLTEVSAQNSAAMTTGGVSPRYDRVVANAITGAVAIVQGTGAEVPVKPDLPQGYIPLASVYVPVGTTRIGNSMIYDERAVWGYALPSDYQEFTSTGSFTWNKPSGFSTNALVKLMMWGPGGGGGSGSGSTTNVGGGGGGVCVIAQFPLSKLSSSVSVTVTPGATAMTAVSSSSEMTSPTLFGSFLAYGGLNGLGSAISSQGGGGGGLFAGGIGRQGGSPLGGSINTASVYGGGSGATGTQPGGASVYGGGGGAGGAIGGNSLYGGAGGGGTQAGTTYAPGTSVFGGNGGANLVAGSAPGGGGGAYAAGARGEVRVWVLRG